MALAGKWGAVLGLPVACIGLTGYFLLNALRLAIIFQVCIAFFSET